MASGGSIWLNLNTASWFQSSGLVVTRGKDVIWVDTAKYQS